MLKVLRNPSKGNMLNSHQSEMCANKAQKEKLKKKKSFVLIGVKEKNSPIGMYCYLALLAHILD